MRLLIASLSVALACLAGGAPGQPDTGATLVDRARVLALVRAGEDAAALAACRTYAAAHPGDLPMRYNLACLEARNGLTAEALATLEQAVGAGYDNIEQMTADPDLADLADDPRFRALVTEIRTPLVLAAAERGVRLAPDRADVLRLSGNRPNPLSSLPELGLSWQTDALVLRLDRGASWLATGDARPGLVVTIGLPDPDEPYRTANGFVFAFGLDAKGHGWGALWVPTLARWQRIAELAPRLEGRDRPALMRIPWSLLQPLHPLTDPLLGINASLDGQHSVGQPGLVFGAIGDPAAFDPTAASHRVVRLQFDASTWSEPAFLGRLEDSIVTADTLDFALVAVPPTAGRGTLKLDFLDNQGRSVLARGPSESSLELVAGRQELTRQASFAGLGTGSYQLRAEIGWPGGGGAVWSTTAAEPGAGLGRFPARPDRGPQSRGPAHRRPLLRGGAHRRGRPPAAPPPGPHRHHPRRPGRDAGPLPGHRVDPAHGGTGPAGLSGTRRVRPPVQRLPARARRRARARNPDPGAGQRPRRRGSAGGAAASFLPARRAGRSGRSPPRVPCAPSACCRPCGRSQGRP